MSDQIWVEGEMDKKEVRGMCKSIEVFVNTSGDFRLRALAKLISGTMHNTLQQVFMKFVIYFIEEMADESKWSVDPRNEIAVKFAKKVLKNVGYEDRYMPCI